MMNITNNRFYTLGDGEAVDKRRQNSFSSTTLNVPRSLLQQQPLLTFISMRRQRAKGLASRSESQERSPTRKYLERALALFLHHLFKPFFFAQYTVGGLSDEYFNDDDEGHVSCCTAITL